MPRKKSPGERARMGDAAGLRLRAGAQEEEEEEVPALHSLTGGRREDLGS